LTADGIAVLREGSGPEVLLIHGGASPETTWSALRPIGERWALSFVHRRGYPPSPPPTGGGGDFEVDASDLGHLLEGCPHVVAHSYGVLGAMIAASQQPDRIRSLTAIEPPLYLVDDPEVEHLKRIGDAVLIHGIEADRDDLREFLRISGASIGDGPLPENVVRGVRRAHGSRLPSEAKPDLDALRLAGFSILVASGAHSPAIERICDAVATRLGAQRLVAPGAGHFVAAAPGFAERLEEFLRSTN
jgi:pimeloyl-ACP methyl ester carboxylesterase